MDETDLAAIRARLERAKENFLDACERDLKANPPRTISEAVTIARHYPSVFTDMETLLDEVEQLEAALKNEYDCGNDHSAVNWWNKPKV